MKSVQEFCETIPAGLLGATLRQTRPVATSGSSSSIGEKSAATACIDPERPISHKQVSAPDGATVRFSRRAGIWDFSDAGHRTNRDCSCGSLTSPSSLPHGR